MKKKLPVLSVLLLLLSVALALAACGAQHEHTFTDWVESVSPTCTAEGERTRTCTGCGEVEHQTVEKAEHTPVTAGDIPATCLEAGLSGVVKCGVCGTVLEQGSPTAPLGHSMSEVWEHGVEDADGAQPKHYHFKRCMREDCDHIEKEYCDLKEEVVQATCEADGYKKMVCEVCNGGEVIQTYQKTGHSWGAYTFDPESKTHKRICQNDPTHIEQEACTFVDGESQKATCENDGFQKKECSKCHGGTTDIFPATGHQYDETYHQNAGERTHYRKCLNCDFKLVEGCDPILDVHEATCEDAGYTVYTCRDCKDSYIGDETPAKGHDLSSPTPVYIDENGEDGDHVHQHEQFCLNANCEHKVVTNCKMTEADVVPATCTTAGYTKLVCPDCQSVHEKVTEEARGHECTYSIMDGTYPYTHKTRCKNCDFERVDNCQMTYVEKKPTCVDVGETRGTCALCIRSVRRGNQVAALGHDYGAWEYTGDMTGHTHHRVCTREGCAAETTGHEQTGECHIVTTEDLPTCDKAGGSKTACDICLTSISEDTIEPLGHSFGQWEADSKSGDHYHTCSKCGQAEHEPHETIVNKYEATCETHAKTVTTCAHCAYELVEEDTSDPVKGHEYHLESYSATEHYARCTNCGDIQHGPHDYSKSNICTYCPHDGLTYVKMGVHYIVKSDDGIIGSKSKKIVIPAEHSEDGSVESLPVKEIARSAFLGNTYIEEVILPVTLDTINDNAFVNCSALRNVSIEGEDTGALKTIGISAFMKCTSLTSFEAPLTLETIGAGAFDGCTSLKDIKIHDDVLSIGADAFADTAYIGIETNWTGNVLYIGKHLIKGRATASDSAVEVRDGTVSINSYAFEGEEVASLILPVSLKIVEVGAFKDCTSLKKVEYKGDMAGWFGIDFKDELSSPLYYDAALHIDAAHDRIVIPNGVTRIPVGTFRGTEITEVVIPSTVTYIGADAFEDCASLAKIQIPTSVTFIGKDAFKNCLYFNTPDNWTDGNALYIDTHLIATKAENVGEEFVVKAGTTTVGIEAFKDCEKLKHVTFADTVVRIGANAFDGCTSLSSVTFEDKESGWLASGRIMRFVSPSQIADPASARAQFHTYYGEWKKSSSKA